MGEELIFESNATQWFTGTTPKDASLFINFVGTTNATVKIVTSDDPTNAALTCVMKDLSGTDYAFTESQRVEIEPRGFFGIVTSGGTYYEDGSSVRAFDPDRPALQTN